MPFINPLITRYPNGMTDVPEVAMHGQMGRAYPGNWHAYWEDFDYYVAANWVVTETDAGATQALADADNGVLLVTNTAGGTDLVSLQKVGESFLPAAGKKMYGEVRFALSAVVDLDFIIGLVITDTTPVDATDGIYFRKADTVATVDLICRKNATTGSNSAVAITTLTAATMTTLSWYFDGVETLYYGLNGTLLGSMSASSAYLPDTEITPTFMLLNGDAVAHTMSIDYLYFAKQR